MKTKYILICSDDREGSTDIVCDWLNYYKQPFIRISSMNKIKIMDVKIFSDELDIEFAIDEKKYLLSEIKSYWYRRSKLAFEMPVYVEKVVNGEDISSLFNTCLKREFRVLVEYFKKELHKKAFLNKENDNEINKLEVLQIASELGLKVPDTLVTREKKSTNLFSDRQLITKAIGDFMGTQHGILHHQKTNQISQDEIFYDSFFSTLFQRQVDKEFELRIFFMENRFYASAIFSQLSEKTKVDFRNYDTENPNRVTPFQLPGEIENKLSLLMKRLDLKSGSIDMAYTKQQEYVFFEVNPVGQFEQVSFPCNYLLHKKIATILSA